MQLPSTPLPRSLLSHERIVFTAAVTTPDALFERVGQCLATPGGPRPAEIAQRLLERHQHRSTALGRGIALPHAAVRDMRAPMAVFVRSRVGLDFAAHDGEPVMDVLALVVPRPVSPRHTDLLRNLRELLTDAAFRRALVACSSCSAVWQLFARCGALQAA